MIPTRQKLLFNPTPDSWIFRSGSSVGFFIYTYSYNSGISTMSAKANERFLLATTGTATGTQVNRIVSLGKVSSIYLFSLIQKSPFIFSYLHSPKQVFMTDSCKQNPKVLELKSKQLGSAASIGMGPYFQILSQTYKCCSRFTQG